MSSLTSISYLIPNRSMHRPQPCILSLSLSRNRLGFAVFRYGDLVYYAGKSLRRFGTEVERRRAVHLIIKKVVERHHVTAVLLPVLNKQQQHSQELRRIYRALDRLAIIQNLPIQRYDPVSARAIICKTKRPTKAGAAQALTEAFPELHKYLQVNTEWERRYYGHVFSAVAGGVAHGR